MLAGAGVSPHNINTVWGVFKAYTTRVGDGPFPSELLHDDGERLRKIGNEYGSTTKRPRRCGWLDLVALRYATILNGITSLVMTKLDVLSEFNTIKICTAYEINGQKTKTIPPCISDFNRISPVLEEVDGFKTDISHITQYSDFPKAAKDFIDRIESYLDIPIGIISTGPERNQTILKN